MTAPRDDGTAYRMLGEVTGHYERLRRRDGWIGFVIGVIVGMVVCGTVFADEWVDMTVHVRLHDDARAVNAECTERAARRGRAALSAMPSCFARSTAPGGGPCIVIARRPKDLDDLAARDRIGAEVENCIAGHVIPVNPQ